MYLRPVFAETDPARIRTLITSNPFGLMITTGERGLEATHLPFVLKPDGDSFTLSGHLAAANPQCDQVAGGTALVVFSGPHAYISPGWYETQPAVPTWDYAAVHVHGTLMPMDDQAHATESLKAMAAHDQAGFDMDAMPEGYRQSMLRGIRGFTLIPDRVEAQWKMSQNRSSADRKAVAAALRRQGDSMSCAVAALIEETLPR